MKVFLILALLLFLIIILNSFCYKDDLIEGVENQSNGNGNGNGGGGDWWSSASSHAST